MADVATATVTFLFTDVEGSTLLLRQLGDRYGEVLGDHQRLLRDAFARHDGREVDTQGDAFFVAFARARDAAAAAVDAQRALAAHAWPDGADLRVRMGLHTGGAALAEERFVGLAVHRAARIAAAGHGGQILVSETTERLLDEEDVPDLRLRDLGARRLKDIERPVRIFQLEAPGLRRDFPPLNTLDVRVRRRRVFVAAAVAPALVLAGALGLVLTREAQIDVQPNSVAVIDAKRNKVVGQVPNVPSPGPIAAGAKAVWVGNVDQRTVSRIDPRTRTIERAISVAGRPTGIAYGDRSVWVAHGLLGTLTRIDTDFDSAASPIAVADRAQSASVAVGLGSVWYVSANSTVARVDPERLRADATGYAGVVPTGVVVAAGAVWVVNRGGNDVSRVNANTVSTVDTFSVGRQPEGIVATNGALWVTSLLDDNVTRFDVSSSSSETIHVGDGPSGIAYGEGSIWVANANDGTLSRIDPVTREVTATIEVGNRPTGVAVASDAVWVTVETR